MSKCIIDCANNFDDCLREISEKDGIFDTKRLILHSFKGF